MNQCSFETVNYTSMGECQSVNYYSSLPWCVNKEGADINIPSQGFMPQSKLTGTECSFLGLVHLAKHSTLTIAPLLHLGVISNALCPSKVNLPQFQLGTGMGDRNDHHAKNQV